MMLEEERRMEWQPIETGPKDGSDILVCRTDFGKELMCVARWSKNYHSSGFYGDEGWMMPAYQGIAHEAVSPPPHSWTALPKPPIRDKACCG